LEKIGIITCYKMSKQCAGKGCFASLNAGSDAFAAHAEAGFELVGFGHCNECCATSPSDIALRARTMQQAGATTLHVSTCIKVKCPHYHEFIEILSRDFKIIPYTHR
jgi:hypothetical protein